MSNTEMPSVFSDKVRTARREHKCCECRRIIKIREKYHLFKGCWEGKWAEFKTCLECDDLRHELREFYYDDEGPPFGELDECAKEAGVEFPVVDLSAGTERVCRVCGCTEFNACPGGCSWVEIDLCSACVKVAA